MTKPGTRIALWVAAAVAVTVVPALAISASVGASGAPLSPAEVARELAAEGATPAASSSARPTVSPDTPSPTQSTDADDSAAPQVFALAPGTVVVRCSAALAELESWTPNPGYRVDDVVRGPASTVSVKFESRTAGEVKVIVSCVGGPTPGKAFARLTHPDDHASSGPSHPVDE